MHRSAPDVRTAGTTTASRALLSAALTGLLCAGAAGCASSDSPRAGTGSSVNGGLPSSTTAHDAGSGDAATQDAHATADAPDASVIADANDAASQGTGSDADDTYNVADAAEDCRLPIGPPPLDGSVTSWEGGITLTLAQFTDLCNQQSGVVELICHCAGANSCKGFSYDEWTDSVSEHTCKQVNTCAGYNCVIPQD
jgi:hypothetical protein